MQFIKPGDVIADRFTIQELIGKGRTSFVYSALDRASDDTRVAIKILNTTQPDRFKRAVFKRETEALRRLNHPNIVGLRDSGVLDSPSTFYLALDYQPYSLDNHLRGGPSPANFEPHRAMRELAEALACAHSQNVIHRDVKPSNILLDNDGRPYLSDFGISKLMTQLSVGETLGSLWSPGYASPEQQHQGTVGPQSDIYSLGAVFFHMLSGQSPPPEGPRPPMVDNYISGQTQFRAVLRRMLAEEPDQREYTSSRLVSALEGITRQVEALTTLPLVLTRTAMGNLRDAGYTQSDEFSAAADVIREQLGGISRSEVFIERDYNDPTTIRVMGDSLRLICKRDDNASNTLIVVAIHAPHQLDHDQQKDRAMPYRAIWEPTQFSDFAPVSDGLARLFETLHRFESENATVRENRRSRRDFIDRWQAVLDQQERKITESGLKYEGVVETDDALRFALSEPPPDNLDWVEDDPLAVEIPSQSSSGGGRTYQVGSLLEIRGNSIEVVREGRRGRRREQGIPQTGWIKRNPIEVRSALNRQDRAIRAFLNGDMVNPSLADVIVEPAGATQKPPPPLDFYQGHLSDDKKEAVGKAISANDLFLIQGPPGTGKTTVIAELALQILRQEPDARILLSSQSNVAVDHALSQISNAAGTEPPSMIRLGRPEKITGDDWTIQGRARVLRQDIRNRCEAVLTELREEERNARRGTHDGDGQSASRVPDGVVEWVDETKELVKELREYEQQHEVLQRSHAPGTMRTYVVDALEDTQARLKDQFDALIELLDLPVSYTGSNAEEVLDHIILATAPSSTTDHVDPDSDDRLRRTQDVRSTIEEWMQVAGNTPDMMRLIIEESSVVAATCLYSGGKRMPESTFDWAIIDEAGRATIPEVLVPIVRSKRIILVGDERQLPPMVEDMTDAELLDITSDYRLDTSLFQILAEQAETAGDHHLATLRRQYRMHPAIGNLISQVFYDGLLEHGVDEEDFPHYDWLPRPVTWLSTSALQNREEIHQSRSFANLAEAELALRWLRDFEEKCRQQGFHPTVGIISGYQAQVAQMFRLIDPENEDRWRNISIEIATVDSFQGRECDVVVYSTVRSNPERRIGFLKDYRRVNVALSRARHQLLIIGDDFMMRNADLETSDNRFVAVLEHIRSNPDECRIVPAGP